LGQFKKVATAFVVVKAKQDVDGEGDFAESGHGRLPGTDVTPQQQKSRPSKARARSFDSSGKSI
jgi:hypothetical protein